MDDKQAFFVQSTDGRKFKMVIRGDLGKLSVGKIRRYLKQYGVPDDQLLLHNGVPLDDDVVGNDFGLRNNSVLQLVSPFDEMKREEANTEEVTRGVHSHNVMREKSRSTPSTVSANARELHSQPIPSRGLASNITSHVDPGTMSGTDSPAQTASTAVFSSNPNSKNNGNNADIYAAGAHAALEVENLQLRDEVQRLRKELELQNRQKHRDSTGGARKESATIDLLHNAKANLKELAEDLGVTLQFDMNLTCVVGTDERQTVLITFDHATERLYVYSTLLTRLPEDAAVRVKLYELLLEGSLLGREVCGGGIGMSLQNGIVVLSTTIPLRHCSSSALKDTMPAFVETLGRWRSLINELVD